MKKITAISMSMILMFGFVGCGTQNNNNTKTEREVTQETTEKTEEETNTDFSTEPEETQGKTLVVYYSATGNTKEAAEYIAEATGGDLFELEPVQPYSDADLDWTDDDSRVSYEHEHPNDREVELKETTVSEWESYNTVYIGYPIWWGIAAWPVDGFVNANDFTGKTVIPFVTSASSGMGESGELLAEAAGTGNWLEGERFPSGVSKEDVQEWVRTN